MKNETICVVDDDIVYQFTAKKILSNLDTVKGVLTFSDGEQAYNYLRDNFNQVEKLPGLIFLDINMPYMDGWTFLNIFKEIKPQLAKQVTIYMVSSSPERKDMDRAKQISEVSDYIVKPITRDIFTEKINSYLHNWFYGPSHAYLASDVFIEQ